MEKKMRVFYTTAFLTMVSPLILVQPLFADMEGDIELLKIIADGYEANLEALRTWKAKVTLKGFHTAIPSTDWGQRQWESQNEFLLDRDQDAIRWYCERVKGTQTLEGKTNPLPQERDSGMIKGEYDYRLTFPEVEKGRRNLLIIPSGRWPRNFQSNVFDPIHILTKEIYPGLIEQLRYYHQLGGKMKSNGSITREGDIVTVETDNDRGHYGRIITRFVFDLSKGCCLREFFNSSRVSESHWKLDYERIADVFVMKKVALTYKDKRKASRYVSTREAVLTNEMVNEPVDPKEFELDKIGMRPGDRVFDRVMGGVSYEWNGEFTPPKMVERTSETVLVEAESFENLGGWVVDQQFMDQMGSPFLLAHGLGEPVKDAITKVQFPTTGKYRVWVRTRNWVAPWKAPAAPGRFQLLINGVALRTIFGTEGTDWHWQDGGAVEITNKQVTIALHDLTGFEGRCDAIVFTTDTDRIPPNKGQRMAIFRRKMLGLPDEPEEAGHFDLVVVGGGIAGTCTSISAARLGLQVALIQNRPILGGNNSSDVRVHLGGEINFPPYPALGNIVKELDSGKRGNAQPAANYNDQRKLRVVGAEKNIHLFLNMHVFKVEKQGDEISVVIAKHIRNGKELRFAAQLFADCTGDGNVGYLAGAEYRMGREGRGQTGESLAPQEPDKMTLGASVQWYSVKTAKPTRFPDCPWALQFTEESCQHTTRGDWDWEMGLHRDQITEFEYIRDHAFRAIYGNWAFQKNKSRDKAKYADRKLEWVAYIGGKRESRRLLGDVILQQQDIQQQKQFPDAFVTTTWTIDLHYPDPKNTKHFPGEEFRSIAKFTRIDPYPIPYRCLYSRNIENLMMAGRCISVTHVALGTVRVMRTCGMMGEVVGMAASLCKKHNTNPRGVYQHHLAELKQLAKRGVGPSATVVSPSSAGPDKTTDDQAFKQAAENGL